MPSNAVTRRICRETRKLWAIDRPMHDAVAIHYWLALSVREARAGEVALEPASELERTRRGGTALVATVLLSDVDDSYECIHMLIEAGAKVNVTKADSNAALIFQASILNKCHMLRTASCCVARRRPSLSARNGKVQANMTLKQFLVNLADAEPNDEKRDRWLELAAWAHTKIGALHHVEVLTAARATALLRGGSNLRYPGGPPPCTPLDCALQHPGCEADQFCLRLTCLGA